MAFSYTKYAEGTLGGKHRWESGTFVSSGGDAGGDIVTSLSTVNSVQLTHTGSSVVASAPVVDETLPLASGTVTIVTVANTAGVYLIEGEQR